MGRGTSWRQFLLPAGSSGFFFLVEDLLGRRLYGPKALLAFPWPKASFPCSPERAPVSLKPLMHLNPGIRAGIPRAGLGPAEPDIRVPDISLPQRR